LNLLAEIVEGVREKIAQGYYVDRGRLRPAPSLVAAIQTAKAEGRTPILAEVKPASPTKGKLVDGGMDALIGQFVSDGAMALSVLTEPVHFHGSLANLRKAVETGLPVLMKDFVVDERQIDCAASHGAAAVLLIASILPKPRLEALVEYAHAAGREVLVEAGDRAEYERALGTEAELVGINNRDLRTFRVDLERTRTVQDGLERTKTLVSLSGYSKADEIRRFKPYADAFLVGSSLVEGTTTVRELAAA
jgi:indole-3-glycerol phosphate synthase